MTGEMTEHPHRHDVWGDDPEERDASKIVDELLAKPDIARRWHDRPSIIWVKAVGRFLGRNGKRIAVTVVGFAVLIIGVLGLVLPILPGWALIFVGLGILATEYLWARRLLKKARDLATAAKDKTLGKKEAKVAKKAARQGRLPSDDAV
jgi:uncharacterized protein (TIGR02611 family)